MDPYFFIQGLYVLFYIITLLFVIFTACLAYHWFTYGSSKSVSALTFCIFLLGSAPLFISMSVALTLL